MPNTESFARMDEYKSNTKIDRQMCGTSSENRHNSHDYDVTKKNLGMNWSRGHIYTQIDRTSTHPLDTSVRQEINAYHSRQQIL